MPDPLTHHEVEDVLNSIRKLVSEAESEARSASKAPDRLVLTPAQRVQEPEPPAGSPDVGPGEDVSPALIFRHDAQMVVEEPPARAEQPAAAADPAPEVEAPFEPAEQPESHVAVTESAAAPAEDVEPETAAHEPEAVRPDDEPEEPEAGAPAEQAALQKEPPMIFRSSMRSAAPEPQSAHERLASRIAELEAAVSASREDFEPDGSEPDAGKMPAHHLFEVIHNSDPARNAPAEASAPESSTRPHAETPLQLVGLRGADAADARRSEAGDLPHQEAEPPSARGIDLPEPANADGGRSDEPVEGVRPVPEPRQRDDLAPQAAAPQPANGSAAEAGELAGDGEDDAEYMDEQMLRELIAQVIREELQGKLGERITQNVRRMVRREIQRALALRDFE